MTDSNERITSLYRHASREEPPAALDHAVLQQARQAVKRRRAAAPFGNPWMAAGSLVTVCLVGVLLVLLLPERTMINGVPYMLEEEAGVERPVLESDRLRETSPDSPAMLNENLPDSRRELRAPAPAAEMTGQSGSDAAKSRSPMFDFYTVVPDEAAAPQRSQQLQKSGEPLPAVREFHYLQTGLFRDPASIPALRTRLAAAGLAVVVDEVSVDATRWHRVRVGPFRTRQALEHARQQLEELGIAYTLETSGE
jgi:cell division septation protein DedD